MRDTEDAEHPVEDPVSKEMSVAMARAGAIHDIPPSVSSMIRSEDKASQKCRWTTKLKMHDGTLRAVHLGDHFKEEYRDEYTNETLPSQWVRDAMHEEIE